MKKTLIAAAAGCLSMAAAHAEGPGMSLTIYGNLDAGLMSQSKTGPTGTGGSANGFVDGELSPTLFGLKGGRDLGDGLNAGFELEAGFSLADGNHNSPGVYQSQVFGRVAKIHFGGSWGDIGMGLQVDPALIASISTEPRGMTDSLSHLEHWILATVGNGTSVSGSLQGGIFDTSAVTYTYAANGLYLGLEHGFGGVAGSSSANSTSSIGASYSVAGFVVSGGYATADSATAGVGKSSVIDSFGAGYTLGPVALRAQYAEFKSNYIGGTASNDVKSSGIGLDYRFGEKHLINVAYYDSKDNGANFGGKTTEIAAYYKYTLFPRTNVYVQAASLKADANAGLSAALGGVYVPSGLLASAGVTTTYFGAGFQYGF